MSTVYGPVPSWRFGRSLGIDVITPPKKCTFNCVYCQLGRTEVHVSGPEKLKIPTVDVDRVLDDLEDVSRRIDLNTVDIVTFSGAGEPTLNPELDNIAKEVKNRLRGIPLAILTNSSLLYLSDVRKGLRQFDLVVAKLDAGDDDTFRLINRPANERLHVEAVVDSIKRLREEIKGTLALEVMLLSSKDGHITNVQDKPLRRLLDAILDVKPDLVQLEVPYRPPSESFVIPPPRQVIKLVSEELVEVLGDDKLWVYGLHDRRGKEVVWLRHKSLEREVLDLLERRPCRVVDVSASLGISLSTAKSLLRKLEKRNLIDSKKSKKDTYYSYRLS